MYEGPYPQEGGDGGSGGNGGDGGGGAGGWSLGILRSLNSTITGDFDIVKLGQPGDGGPGAGTPAANGERYEVYVLP